MPKKRDDRIARLIEQVWCQLGANRLEERWIRDRHGWLGYQEPGKLVISPLNLIQTVIHEALHAAFPAWTERGVARAEAQVWKALTDDECYRLYLAYSDKVQRIAKPADSRDPE